MCACLFAIISSIMTTPRITTNAQPDHQGRCEKTNQILTARNWYPIQKSPITLHSMKVISIVDLADVCYLEAMEAPKEERFAFD